MTSRALSAGPFRVAIWGGIAVILLLPLVAMRFTDEVNWTAFDFAVAAVILGGGALGWEIATRLTRDTRRRGLAAAAILVVVLLVWAQGAVGVF